MDIALMSIGFFIKPTDALLWRGAMAVNALKQMIHQTRWGTLDFLLADLPPGTGDIHLSIIGELKIDSAVIVSTPQQVAVADVLRGVEMFRNPNVNIPVAASSKTWPGSRPKNCPTTATIFSAKAEPGNSPRKTAWTSWAKYPSYAPSWRVPTRDTPPRPSIRGWKHPIAASPNGLLKK